MEGKRHPFGETIPEERGAGGFEVVGLLCFEQHCIQKSLVSEPKIDSHIVLFFLLTTMTLTPISLTNFYKAAKHGQTQLDMETSL